MSKPNTYDTPGHLQQSPGASASRREVLVYLGVVAASLALPSAQTIPQEQNDTAAALARRVAGLLGFKQIAAGARSVENNVLELLSQVLQREATNIETIRLPDSQLKALIQERMAGDYSKCELVNVHGWWISRTEARCIDFVSALREGRIDSNWKFPS